MANITTLYNIDNFYCDTEYSDYNKIIDGRFSDNITEAKNVFNQFLGVRNNKKWRVIINGEVSEIETAFPGLETLPIDGSKNELRYVNANNNDLCSTTQQIQQACCEEDSCGLWYSISDISDGTGINSNTNLSRIVFNQNNNSCYDTRPLIALNNGEQIPADFITLKSNPSINGLVVTFGWIVQGQILVSSRTFAIESGLQSQPIEQINSLNDLVLREVINNQPTGSQIIIENITAQCDNTTLNLTINLNTIETTPFPTVGTNYSISNVYGYLINCAK